MKHKPSHRFSRYRHTYVYRVARRIAHFFWYGVALALALAAVAYVVARLAAPMVAERKSDLEAFLSRQSIFKVSIGAVDAYWDGLHPGIRLKSVSIQAPVSNRPLVQLEELRVTPKLFPLLLGHMEIRSLTMVRPVLGLTRSATGEFHVSGLDAFGMNSDTEHPDAFILWLFNQGEFLIEDGTLLWQDAHEAGEAMRLTRINLQLQNDGDRHRLGVQASVPQGRCSDCVLVADITGNPFLDQPLNGAVYVRGRDLDVAKFPLIARERIPSSLHGTFTVELWSKWAASRPVSVEGNVNAKGLMFSLDSFSEPVSIRRAGAKFLWEGQTDDYRLEMDDTNIALTGNSDWTAGRIEWQRRKQETLLKVDNIELSDVSAFIATLQPSSALRQGSSLGDMRSLLRGLKPRGSVSTLRAQLIGSPGQPDDFTISADVSGFGVSTFERWPGVEGAGGTLLLHRNSGELQLDMRDGSVTLPRVFAGPVPVARATGGFRWERRQDRWIVLSDEFAVLNEDIQLDGKLKLELPDDATSPVIALGMTCGGGNIHNIKRYFPIYLLEKGTLAWMERSFLGGVLTGGEVELNGPIWDFPFRSGGGNFTVRTNLRDGVYRYLPGWELAKNVAANILVQGEHFVVTAQGNIGSLKAQHLAVFGDFVDHVQATTSLSGSVTELVHLLNATQGDAFPAKWKALLPTGLDTRGDGVLSLSLDVPIDHRPIQLRGEYRMADVTMTVPQGQVLVRKLGGQFDFTHSGVHGGRVHGEMFGGQTTLTVTTPRPDEIDVSARGQITAAGLAPWLGKEFVPHVAGAVPWQAHLQMKGDQPRLQGQADLTGLRLTLPAPLNDLNAEKIELTTESTSSQGMTLALRAGETLRSRLRVMYAGGWRFGGGRFTYQRAAGSMEELAAIPDDGGLHVALKLDQLNLDEWTPYVGGDGSTSSMPLWIKGIELDVSRLTYADRAFGAAHLDMARTRDDWRGSVRGDSASGVVGLISNPSAIQLDLQYLRWPEATRKSSRDLTDTDPRKLPTLLLRVASLRAMGRDLGVLNFAGHATENGWKLDHAVMLLPETTRLEINGLWRVQAEKSTSDFTFQLAGDDLGKTMGLLGFAESLQGGKGNISGHLNWVGRPSEIAYPTLSGELDIKAEKGRFLQLNTGAGRLFGILDLTAVFRYMLLDFSPIFGKGYEFESVRAKLRIQRGNVVADKFEMKGPTARVTAGGRIGLVAEDFDLTVTVYPNLSSGLTLGGLLLGGPQIALWTYLVNKMLKSPLDQGAHKIYQIRGPWKNPKIVSEAKGEPQNPQNPQNPQKSGGR